MAPKLRIVCTFAVLFISFIYPASAQIAPSDLDAEQTIGLFQQACLPFAGDVRGLRDWISAHELPQLPSEQAAPFLGSGSGQVFGASTPSVKLALVSKDDGACEVIAMTGDALVVERILRASLGTLGASVSQVLVQSKPDGSSTQYLFEATLGGRDWKISITSKPHTDAPELAPELRLLATPE